jgi:hypothetical protein
MKQAIQNFLRLVEKNDFLEAHEILEDNWRTYKNTPHLRDESFLIKGLINGATALVLQQLQRESSAYKVWNTFKKYEPLVDTITSEHIQDYKQAIKLLHLKYEKFFTCKSI